MSPASWSVAFPIGDGQSLDPISKSGAITHLDPYARNLGESQRSSRFIGRNYRVQRCPLSYGGGAPRHDSSRGSLRTPSALSMEDANAAGDPAKSSTNPPSQRYRQGRPFPGPGQIRLRKIPSLTEHDSVLDLVSPRSIIRRS